MAWPVWTERFVYINGETGSKSWVVPDEMRAIVTCITYVSSAAGGPAAGLVFVHGIPIFRRIPAVETTELVQLRCVAYQGESIGVSTGGPAVYISVNGYLLQDTTGRDGPPPSASSKPVRPPLPWPTPLE